MPRRIDFAGTSEDCRDLLDRLRGRRGVARLVLQPGASVEPEGDVLEIHAANGVATEIVNLLDEIGLLERGAVTLSEPSALVSEREAAPINEEGNDAIWEEIGAMMRQDTNPSFNFLLLMTLSGAVAAFGIVSGTFHIVVGAMLIAPGFEPILRIVFGLLGHRHSALEGLKSMVGGYLALACGAGLAVVIALPAEGVAPAALPTLHWAGYWSRIELSGVTTSLFAGIAGGTIVSSRMKVLSTGVMVALALIPAMALVGMGLATGNGSLALAAFARWSVEAGCVILGGGGVLVFKKLVRHRRRTA